LLVATAASAAPIIYFGEDLGLGESTVLPATPNADAAQFAFLAGLIDPGLETFEGIAAGTTAPFAINFANGVTATVTGAGTVVSLADGVAAAGRYGVTGDADADERYLDTGGGANAFVLTFSQPVSAFGFFGIDIGDFNGQVTATTAGGLNQIFNIGNTIAGAGGGVLFWGVIDPAQTFTSIAFGNTGSGADFFGFDDFTIGSPEQVRVIPEPATLSLLGIGLATAAIRRRRLSRR
jgi:hypothetical protein